MQLISSVIQFKAIDKEYQYDKHIHTHINIYIYMKLFHITIITIAGTHMVTLTPK